MRSGIGRGCSRPRVGLRRRSGCRTKSFVSRVRQRNLPQLARYLYGKAIPVIGLDEKSLDRFLGLSSWTEPLSDEPLPGPLAEAANWSRQGEIDRIRASVRTMLTGRDGL